MSEQEKFEETSWVFMSRSGRHFDQSSQPPNGKKVNVGLSTARCKLHEIWRQSKLYLFFMAKIGVLIFSQATLVYSCNRWSVISLGTSEKNVSAFLVCSGAVAQVHS